MKWLNAALVCYMAGVSQVIFAQALATTPNVAPPSTRATNDSLVKNTYLVVYKPGPGWLAGKPIAEQPLKEHGRYILSLYVKGSLKYGGPFSDETGGAAAFQASSDEEAKAIVAEDPAVRSGVFVAEVHPWGLVDWPRLAKK